MMDSKTVWRWGHYLKIVEGRILDVRARCRVFAIFYWLAIKQSLEKGGGWGGETLGVADTHLFAFNCPMIRNCESDRCVIVPEARHHYPSGSGCTGPPKSLVRLFEQTSPPRLTCLTHSAASWLLVTSSYQNWLSCQFSSSCKKNGFGISGCSHNNLYLCRQFKSRSTTNITMVK
jgi:hypothetical protein